MASKSQPSHVSSEPAVIDVDVDDDVTQVAVPLSTSTNGTRNTLKTNAITAILEVAEAQMCMAEQIIDHGGDFTSHCLNEQALETALSCFTEDQKKTLVALILAPYRAAVNIACPVAQPACTAGLFWPSTSSSTASGVPSPPSASSDDGSEVGDLNVMNILRSAERIMNTDDDDDDDDDVELSPDVLQLDEDIEQQATVPVTSAPQNLDEFPIKCLRRCLLAAQVDFSMCVEKADLIALVKDHQLTVDLALHGGEEDTVMPMESYVDDMPRSCHVDDVPCRYEDSPRSMRPAKAPHRDRPPPPNPYTTSSRANSDPSCPNPTASSTNTIPSRPDFILSPRSSPIAPDQRPPPPPYQSNYAPPPPIPSPSIPLELRRFSSSLKKQLRNDLFHWWENRKDRGTMPRSTDALVNVIMNEMPELKQLEYSDQVKRKFIESCIPMLMDFQEEARDHSSSSSRNRKKQRCSPLQSPAHGSAAKELQFPTFIRGKWICTACLKTVLYGTELELLSRLDPFTNLHRLAHPSLPSATLNAIASLEAIPVSPQTLKDGWWDFCGRPIHDYFMLLSPHHTSQGETPCHGSLIEKVAVHGRHTDHGGKPYTATSSHFDQRDQARSQSSPSAPVQPSCRVPTAAEAERMVQAVEMAMSLATSSSNGQPPPPPPPPPSQPVVTESTLPRSKEVEDNRIMVKFRRGTFIHQFTVAPTTKMKLPLTVYQQHQKQDNYVFLQNAKPVNENVSAAECCVDKTIVIQVYRLDDFVRMMQPE